MFFHAQELKKLICSIIDHLMPMPFLSIIYSDFSIARLSL